MKTANGAGILFFFHGGSAASLPTKHLDP